MLLSVLVMVFAGRRFYAKAWAAARHRTSDMNTLIAVGTGAAFLYSAAVTIAPAAFESHGVAAEVYFEAVIFILALVLAGNVMEARARRRASSAMRALARLQPATARVEFGGEEIETPLGKLKLGDIVVVRPGERVPADAVVLSGASGVDESMLTGEPVPVDKQAGSAIIGGTTNGQGVLSARVTALGGETMLEKVLRLLRAAQGEKAPMQRLADRVSAVFVPAVFGIALLTFAVWAFAAHDSGASRRRGRGGAHHRLPLRHGAGRADGGDGRHRARGATGDPRARRRCPGADGVHRYGGLRQDRNARLKVIRKLWRSNQPKAGRKSGFYKCWRRWRNRRSIRSARRL